MMMYSKALEDTSKVASCPFTLKLLLILRTRMKQDQAGGRKEGKANAKIQDN